MLDEPVFRSNDGSLIMCLEMPGHVVDLVDGSGDQIALVDVQGKQRKINIGMLDPVPAVNDWVLVHLGFALDVLTADEAEEILLGLTMPALPLETAEHEVSHA